MKAADLADDDVVAAVVAVRAARGLPASRWDLSEHFPGVPEKVLLAKLRRLVQRGVLDGCACGCRGDFEPKPG